MMNTQEIENLLPLIVNTDGKTMFEIVKEILDHYPHLLQEIFIRTRCFDLGLQFYDLCQNELNANLTIIDDYYFQKYQISLIRIRLSMLDYLNEWDEYVSFFEWALENVFAPYEFGERENVDPKYIYLYEGKQKIHFLYQQDDRYNLTIKKIERRNLGKSTKHLERHQQHELSQEDIEFRFKNAINDIYCFNLTFSRFYNK